MRDLRRPQLGVPAAVLIAVVAVGCSSSSSGAKASSTASSVPPSSASAPASTGTATAPPTPSGPATKTLTVLISNDDGVKAPGIDTLVQAVRKEPGVTVDVVAPATNQSGTGGKTTAGPVRYAAATTASGYPATEVFGTPSDSVTVAFTQLKLHPDLVLSGINAGQNLGPIVDISGTVGAARVGARHGVKALAISSGAPGFTFAAAVPYALQWLRAERSAATPTASASSRPATVDSLNVPSCPTGSVRGELMLARQTAFGAGQSALGTQDCTSTTKPNTEVAAFTDGFATLVPLPLNPGS